MGKCCEPFLVSPREVMGQDHADFSSSGDAVATPEKAGSRLAACGQGAGWINCGFSSFPAAALS